MKNSSTGISSTRVLSPGKITELLTQGQCRWIRLATQSAIVPDSQCIEPLGQDKRFQAPAWHRWPFNLIYQSFLLNQQGWQDATTGMEGLGTHREQMTTFFNRQWLDTFSPSNYLLTNPEVLEETARSLGGTR